MVNLTNKNYVPLGFDLMTKKVFGDSNDDKPIKLLLEIILGIKVKKVTILNNELIDKPYKDKKTSVDLLIESDDERVIGIEINTNVSTMLIIRNLFYMFRVASRDLNPNEEYSKLKYHIQVNFDLEGYHEFPIMVYTLRDEVTNTLLTDKFKILRIDVPFFYNVLYNNDIDKLEDFIKRFKMIELDMKDALRLTKFISLFNERDIIKANELVKGDKDMEHVYDKVIENSDELIGAYDKESHDRFIRNAYLKEQTELALEKGHKEGLEQGLKEGIEEGIEKGIEKGKIENTKTMVLNMLNKNIDINLISEISGLSIDEIKKMRK